MSDRDQRSLERTWQASGSKDDYEALRREQKRSGQYYEIVPVRKLERWRLDIAVARGAFEHVSRAFREFGRPRRFIRVPPVHDEEWYNPMPHLPGPSLEAMSEATLHVLKPRPMQKIDLDIDYSFDVVKTWGDLP